MINACGSFAISMPWPSTGISDVQRKPARSPSRPCRCKFAISRSGSAWLIERRPGDVTLTEVGKEVVRRGEHVLAAARDLVDFARHRSHTLVGA